MGIVCILYTVWYGMYVQQKNILVRFFQFWKKFTFYEQKEINNRRTNNPTNKTTSRLEQKVHMTTFFCRFASWNLKLSWRGSNCFILMEMRFLRFVSEQMRVSCRLLTASSSSITENFLLYRKKYHISITSCYELVKEWCGVDSCVLLDLC